MSAEWERYQETARVILNEVAAYLGLSRVEGKQSIPGLRSGTNWNLDAKGCSEDAETFVIIEVRRYTNSRQKQEQLGALAYRIIDT